MSICQLPETTVRQLGASVLIVSPVSLTKELVDNAIDAGASNIEISMSANAVDQILVRDNGHGISPRDFDALGRRAHTSKLRTFEELQCKGGSTLGFRGEALASTNTVSRLTITTKTAEDPVATLLVLNPKGGGILSQKHVSSPVGTTVDVSNLFADVPVRREQTIKESKKSCDQVKELLYKYALTRPHIKLSLRVLKSKRLYWSYAPRRVADVREAALLVFGSELVSQCILKTYRGNPDTTRPHTPASVLRLDAFLPKADADPSVIARKGYFFSVDDRPMTYTRGTMKKMAGIYKTYLRRCLIFEDSSKTITTPFIRLNIQCILGSYDPNVAAGKDEVLFANEPKLLALFEEMCREVYRPAEPSIDAMDGDRKTKQKHDENFPGLIRDSDEELTEWLAQGIAPEGTIDTHKALARLSPSTEGEKLVNPYSEQAHLVNREEIYDKITRCVSPVKNPTISEEGAGSMPAVASNADGASDGPLSQGHEEMSRLVQRHESQTSQSDLVQATHGPNMTQYILRTGWEVDMARTNTASPPGETQDVPLHPPSANIAEHISTQRVEQTQREQPNPWSLAKRAAEKYGVPQEYGAENSPRQTERPLEIEELLQELKSGIELSPEEQDNPPVKQSRRQRAPAAQREGSFETDDLELPRPRYPGAPHGHFQALRHQEEGGILRDEEKFQPSGVRHEVDEMVSGAARGLGVRQHARAQTPHPLAKFNLQSVLGTPPPSSSPLKKPFRVPAHLGPNKQDQWRSARVTQQGARRGGDQRADGLTQSKLTFSTRKGTGFPPQGDALDHFLMIDDGNEDFVETFAAIHVEREPCRQVSPDPTEREMDMALERLNALRPKADGTGEQRGDIFEGPRRERGRSPLRRPTTTLPDMSPCAYLRKILSSRSSSRTKTHKRMRSEKLPLERPVGKSFTELHPVTIDLNNLQQQTIKASICDLYVQRGLQEAAFALEPAEMDGISNRLQELAGLWMFETHGVEMDLEMNIGEILMESQMDLSC